MAWASGLLSSTVMIVPPKNILSAWFCSTGTPFPPNTKRKNAIKNRTIPRDRNLLLADAGLWAISRSTTLPLSVSHHSSLLFSITNTQFAPISGYFQAPLPSGGMSPHYNRRITRNTTRSIIQKLRFSDTLSRLLCSR